MAIKSSLPLTTRTATTWPVHRSRAAINSSRVRGVFTLRRHGSRPGGASEFFERARYPPLILRPGQGGPDPSLGIENESGRQSNQAIAIADGPTFVAQVGEAPAMLLEEGACTAQAVVPVHPN